VLSRQLTVTDEMVERMCVAMERDDWLPHDWAATHNGICECCNQAFGSDGDGGANTRSQVRWFLECALGLEDPLT
jgi:hypothetical protein